MLTDHEYAVLRARADRYNAWWQANADGKRDPKTGELVSWSSMPAEREPPEDARISNDDRAALEVYEFVRDKPARYFAYWREHEPRVSTGGDGVERATASIVTFTGAHLADVVWRGPAHRTPAFGRASVRVNFRARGINGVLYAGTYYKSSGSYVRMRAMKG